MADYFTYFSVVLPLNQEQQAYATGIAQQITANRYEDHQFPADFPSDLADVMESWTFETEVQKEGLWLHSIEGGQDAVCAFIQHLLQKFDFAPFVQFEWSYDCTKPRIDAYGGGAAFITSTEIETFTTTEWLQKMSC